MQLTIEDWALQIHKYGEEAISTFPIGWTSFYQDPLSLLEYIILDAFHVTKILTAKAI